MKKFLPHILIFLITVGFFGPITKVSASPENPTEPCTYIAAGQGGAVIRNAPCVSGGSGGSQTETNPINTDNTNNGNTSGGNFVQRALGVTFNLASWVLSPLGYALMGITSLILMLSGVILNASIYFTVVQMTDNFTALPAINVAWTTIRDLANMAFIFVLLYSSIMLIIGQGKDTQRMIVRMVVAAILINFSMFFTKVIIDVANLLALTFYSAIAPQAQLSKFLEAGLSNSVIKPLGVQALYQLGSAGFSSGTSIFTTAIMSSVVFLITAFSFFAIAIMFIIRYVVLIFVIILSPLMFISMILPALSSYRDQWWKALTGQAFFAPIYFLLMWVTISIIQELNMGGAAGSDGFANAIRGAADAIPLLVNFIVIIAFLIATLLISKGVADKAGGGVASLNKWALGKAGGASFGLAGRLGRKTLGAAGSAMGDSERLKRMEEKGGVSGAMARLGLAAGRKTAKQSFDLRGSALGGTLNAGKAQSGGFAEDFKQAAKKQKEYGESLKPSDIVVDEAVQGVEMAKDSDTNSEEFKKGWIAEQDKRRFKMQQADDTLFKLQANDTLPPDIKAELVSRAEKELRNSRMSYSDISTADQYKKEKIEEAKMKVDDLKGVTDDDRAKEIIRKEMVKEEKSSEEIEEFMKNKEAVKARIAQVKKDNKSAGDRRKEAYAKTLTSTGFGRQPWNPVLVASRADKQAAAELRKNKKPVKDVIEELLRAEGDLPKKDEAGEEPSSDTSGDKGASATGGATKPETKP
ncbi:MAG: hypothetical protein AAB660_00235 [Patescibacteria group bacterium]